ADPSYVSFTNYDLNGTYYGSLTLRNISAVMRGLRVLPPTSAYFCITSISYPQTDSQAGSATGHGELAPGMGAKVAIAFM
ncbi:unnamed protein product, partial [Chrysoparadoxa australica]